MGLHAFEHILYEVKDAIAVITFHRPEALNAMNQQLWLDLEMALSSVLKDENVRALIITGSGRAFSSGADLKESGKRTQAEYRQYLEKLQQISLTLIEFPKPVVASINGYAIGSGYELALACDFRIAAIEAKIGSPEVKVESSVTGGALRLLPQLIGMAKAKELMLLGEYIDGEEAARIGLVHKVVPLADLMSTAIDFAERLAQNSPLSIDLIKRGLNFATTGCSMETLMQHEVDSCIEAVSTKERAEKLKDFQKRKK